MHRVVATRTVAAGEPLRALADRLRTPLFEPGGALAALHPVEQTQLQAEAAKLAEVFQRSSSHVEGRNGGLDHRVGHFRPRSLMASALERLVLSTVRCFCVIQKQQEVADAMIQAATDTSR